MAQLGEDSDIFFRRFHDACKKFGWMPSVRRVQSHPENPERLETDWLDSDGAFLFSEPLISAAFMRAIIAVGTQRNQEIMTKSIAAKLREIANAVERGEAIPSSPFIKTNSIAPFGMVAMAMGPPLLESVPRQESYEVAVVHERTRYDIKIVERGLA